MPSLSGSVAPEPQAEGSNPFEIRVVGDQRHTVIQSEASDPIVVFAQPAADANHCAVDVGCCNRNLRPQAYDPESGQESSRGLVVMHTRGQLAQRNHRHFWLLGAASAKESPGRPDNSILELGAESDQEIGVQKHRLLFSSPPMRAAATPCFHLLD